MRLVVATKIKQVKRIQGNTVGHPVGSHRYGGCRRYIDIEENADTFEGNALLKADQVMKQCGEITVADDSGICVNAWRRARVYSARYAGITPPIWKII